jgi:hypothetical protein
MLNRILSFLGIAPRMPSLPSSLPGDRGSAGPETDGQAIFRYAQGTKAPPSQAETEETQDQRRDRITDKDLAWPGKVETLHFRNDEPIAVRADLTITDLDTTLYVRRPPVGGTWQSQGGVLLQPGEETDFEIVFLPPADPQKARPRTFSFVLTRFDPRRANDPGEIFAEMNARWVPLPGNDALRLAAEPQEVLIRPWRRAAVFALELINRSELPPSVQIAVLRGPTKEALLDKGDLEKGENVEKAGTLSQSLPSRTGCTWHALLPPARTAGSYYATAAGTARVAESTDYTLSLARPVFVRYVPWLRMGRDWAFLAVCLLALVWIAWGIPVHEEPLLFVTLDFPGGDLTPPRTYDHLQVSAIPGAGTPIPAAEHQGKVYTIKPHARWAGYRWPFGWNGPSREPQKYTIQAFVPNEDNKPLYNGYALDRLRSQTNLNGNPTLEVSALKLESEGKKTSRGFLEPWTIRETLFVHPTKALRVKLKMASLGAAKGNAESVHIVGTMDGQEVLNVTPLLADISRQLEYELKTAPDQTGTLVLSGNVPDSGIKLLPVEKHVEPQETPFEITLSFPKACLTDLPKTIHAGDKVVIPVQGSADGMKVIVGGQAITVRTSPAGIVLDIPKNTHTGKVKLETQSPGEQKVKVGEVTIEAPLPPPPKYADDAYKALLVKNNDLASVNAMKLTDAKDDPIKHALLGYVALRNQQNDQAKAEFAQVVAEPKGDSRALALALTGLGVFSEDTDPKRAQQLYEQALHTNSKVLLAYINYALFLKKQHPDLAKDELAAAKHALPHTETELPIFTTVEDFVNKAEDAQ